MDLSSLLQQTELSYKKLTKQQKPSIKSTQKLISIFTQNLDTITSYLQAKQIENLRLICRGIGYLFIVKDIWVGIKNQVADKKLQDFDDYQFVQEQPKIMNKQDKKIRIHSLKKNVSLNKNLKRQSSNMKQKKMSISIVNQDISQFQKTQIGFKRLLKTNNPRLIKNTSFSNSNIQQPLQLSNLIQLLSIPNEYTMDDLIINAKDQWVKNLHRANNLITVVKKWNLFHQRFIEQISKQEYNVLEFMTKLIKADQCMQKYKKVINQQPYHTIIIILEGAYKNTLIQDKLNQLGKQFMDKHKQFMELIQNKHKQQLITYLHQFYQKLIQKYNRNILNAITWTQGLNLIDQSFDFMISKTTHQKLRKSLTTSIINVIKKQINKLFEKNIQFQNQQIRLKKITIKFVINNAQFCQLVFQIFYNLYGKLDNIVSKDGKDILANNSNKKMLKNEQSYKSKPFEQKLKAEKLSISTFTSSKIPKLASTLTSFNKSEFIQTSFKQQKSLYGILWNISKYIDKLQKQMHAKQGKKNQQQKIQLIKQFLQNDTYLIKEQILLFNDNNQSQEYKLSLARVEQYYKVFKQKVQHLKQQMMGKNQV